MDLITTGVSASERMRRDIIASATRAIIMEKMRLGGPSMRLLEVSLSCPVTVFFDQQSFANYHTMNEL